MTLKKSLGLLFILSSILIFISETAALYSKHYSSLENSHHIHVNHDKSSWSSAKKKTLKLKHIFHRSVSDPRIFLKAEISQQDEMAFQSKGIPLEYQVQYIESGFQKTKSYEIPLLQKEAYTTKTEPESEKHYKRPNHKDKATVIALAEMTYNAYYGTGSKEWTNIDGWNVSTRFGWESDGIRGYVFVDEDQDIMVITVKGTSATWIGGGPTSPRDKINDNLMFSCCCAYVDVSWRPSCSCPSNKSSYTCSSNCIKQESNVADSYFNLAQTIYVAIRSIYPSSISIWLTGHSLGGSLASLLGLTNGVPVFAYNAPGDLLYASRIGLLPTFPNHTRPDYSKFLSTLPIYHFGNNGDPIFKGTCQGAGSTCYWGGYAMESKCHVGKVCEYDIFNQHSLSSLNHRSSNTILKFQGSSEHEEHHQDYSTTKEDIRNHGIVKSLEYIRSLPVPECKLEEKCEDCKQWIFED